MAQPLLATLRIATPNQPELLVPIHEGTSLQLGRDPSSDIVLDDPAVSRVHALFSASQQQLSVTDLSSRNGTMVNGQQIFFITRLTNGDTVNIGLTKIAIEQEQTQSAVLSPGRKARCFTVDLQPIDVVVMAVTIRNFSALQALEQSNAEQDILGPWHKAIKDSIKGKGGLIEQALGHNILALWWDGTCDRLAKAAAETAAEIFSISDRLLPKLPPGASPRPDPLVLLGLGRGMRPYGDVKSEEQQALLLPSPEFDAFYLMSFLERAIPAQTGFLVVTQTLLEYVTPAPSFLDQGTLHSRDTSLTLYQWQKG